jgi:hypothetical protein
MWQFQQGSSNIAFIDSEILSYSSSLESTSYIYSVLKQVTSKMLRIFQLNIITLSVVYKQGVWFSK